MAYHSDSAGNITFKCRPLEEYADDPWAQDYLGAPDPQLL
jgi:hypothetical protein